MKKGISTALYCQSCGSRLLWCPDNRVEVKLEADGTVHGLTLFAACVNCQSTYSAWLPILQAPAWWKETRADTSRSTHKHESLKNYQRATRQRDAAQQGE